MCLCITDKAKLYRAKKPILVYKQLYPGLPNTYFSPFLYADYIPGDMKTSPLTREKNEIFEGIGKGLHSYARSCGVYGGMLNKPCVIPEGAYFIVGDFGGTVSIASTHLMLLPEGKASKFKPLNVKDHQVVRPVSDFGYWIVR